MVKKYTKLVVGGGAMKGVSLIGTLKYFEEYKMVDSLAELLGCSIGAIFCLFIVLDHNSTYLEEFILNTDLDIFTDQKLHNLIQDFGFSQGLYIEHIIKKIIKDKGYDENITLLELYNKTQKKLICIACNINNGETVFFEHESFPDFPVYMAVRASISIPFIFTPLEYNGCLYVDGGVTCNFPINYYKNNSKILYIYLDNMIKNNPSEIKSLDLYIHRIMKSACYGSDKVCLAYAEKHKYNLIRLKPSIDNIFDFTISNIEKKRIIDDGYNCTRLYFEKKKQRKIKTEIDEQTNKN